MLISINGRFLTQPLTGVQRYAIETVREIDHLLAEQPLGSRPSCELLAPPGAEWAHGPLRVIQLRTVGRLSGQLWEQFELPFAAQGPLLNLCNTYPVLARKPVVTVHDAAIYAAPGGFTTAFRLLYRLLFTVLRIRRSIPMMTVSAFSADEITRYTGLQRARINVVPCGSNHWARVVPDTSVLDRLGLHAGQFVLSVASENPNKNLARLVEAFGRTSACGRIPLVLVGGQNSRVFADAGGVDPHWVLRTGHISDAELAGLYQSALCFAFPSLYEGFGIPPLEAMTFGCPVLVSREASLPEVCGDAAEYCDGYDVQSIADGLDRLLSDVRRRDALARKGRARIAGFQWRSTAKRVLDQVGLRS